MRRVLVAVAMTMTAIPAGAQAITVVAGADVVRGAEYRGGHSGLAVTQKGVLVLSDSALALFVCKSTDCMNATATDWDRTSIVLSIPLASVQGVEISTSRRGPSATSRFMWGVFAKDRNEGYVAVTYAVGGTVETPVFKTGDAVAPALEAKIRFRAKKLGVQVEQ